MAGLKNIQDLAAKCNRNNKDRALVGDLLEITRQLKGFENEYNELTRARTTLANEIVKLKREIAELKKGGAAAPAEAAPQAEPGGRTAEGFVWKK